MADPLQAALPYVVIANAGVVALALAAFALVLSRRGFEELPGPVQNALERGLEWFVGQARSVRADAVKPIAPFLFSLFAFILGCDLLAVLPLPLLRIPPTSYFGATVALSSSATAGVLLLSVRLQGTAHALKHLVWPNPLQLVSEASHVLSLALRLFGNIGGEYLVATLVFAAVPWGLPLVIHALGLVPAVVQPVVFTLLVANFLAEAVHASSEHRAPVRPAPTRAAEVP